MASFPAQGSSSGLVAACITITIIETFFFVLRTASRTLSRANVGADDYIISVSYPILVGLNACLIAMVYRGGAGLHIKDIVASYGPAPVETFLKLQVAVAELYVISLALPKLAIVSLYLRIFIQKPIRVVCRILQIVLVCYPLAWFIGYLVVCRPISALWLLEPPPGTKCGDLDALEKYISVPNIVTDVVMLVLPMHAVWKLQLSAKDKIGVMVILCAGGMGLVVSCVRLAFWFLSDLTDITYVAPTVGKFTCLEVAGYFIAACVPVLKPVVDHLGKMKPLTSIRSLRSLLTRSRATQSDSEALPTEDKISATSSDLGHKGNHSVSVDGVSDEASKRAELEPRPRNIEVQYDFSVTRSEH